MTIDIISAGTTRSRRNSGYSQPWIALLGLLYLGGCSLQGFDYLSKGGASSSGGFEQSGGSTNENIEGGSSNTGGVSNTVANAGGANAGGTNAGGTNAGGAMNTGGTLPTTSSTHDGGLDLSGCAFTPTGGKLLVPPSQGFESDLNGWSTTAANTGALSRVAGNGTNCEGNWYLHCDGSRRGGNWDGPELEVGSLVTLGHTYQFSVAARQVPASSPASTINLKLTYSVLCAGISTPEFHDPYSTPALTDWVRLTAQIPLTAPAGCTAPVTVTSVRLYVAQIETVGPFPSIDVDDFKLVDLSVTGTADAGN